MSPTSDISGDDAHHDGKHEEFLNLLSRCQRELYVYVMSLVHDWAAADEVVQETNLALWRKFDTYTPGTNFAAWATVIAYHRALRYRRKQSRDRHVFSDRFEESALTAAKHVSDLDDRRDALAGCLEKLPPADRAMIEKCYANAGGIKGAATAVGQSPQIVYRIVARIRDRLHDCITTKLRSEAGT